MRRALSQSGSTSLVALITVTTLTFIAASFIVRITDRSREGGHSSAWVEASQIAESAAAVALAEVRRVLPNPVPFPDDAWSGWSASLNGVPVPLPTDKSFPAGLLLQRTLTLTHAGEENPSSSAVVTIDAPAALRDSNGNAWLRVRAIGTTQLAGGRRVSQSSVDRHLRRLALWTDSITGRAVSQPQVQRNVEWILQPAPQFAVALQSPGTISGGSNQSYIDSYDSTDSRKSTSGEYDSAKAQAGGDVWTNSRTFSFVGSILGDLATDGASLPNNLNVSGQVDSSHYLPLAPIEAPDWGALNLVSVPIVFSTSLNTSSGGGATRYHLSGIYNTVTLKANKDARGNIIPSQVELWVDGDIAASIVVEKGVQATIWLGGNMSLNSSQLSNPSHDAANLQIYGIDPDGVNRSITLNMNSDFYGAIYAPGHDLTVTGNSEMFGSFAAATMKLKNKRAIHFDESLARRVTTVLDYRVASWIEDVR